LCEETLDGESSSDELRNALRPRAKRSGEEEGNEQSGSAEGAREKSVSGTGGLTAWRKKPGSGKSVMRLDRADEINVGAVPDANRLYEGR
jgi:hypothetical protein